MKHRLGRRQSQEHDLRGAWPGDTLTILTEQVGQKKGIARVTSDFTVGAYGLVKKLLIFKRTFERLGRVRGMHDIIMASIC